MGNLTQLKKRLEEQKASRPTPMEEGKVTGVLQKQTPVALNPLPSTIITPVAVEVPSRLIIPRTKRLPHGVIILNDELPMGYHALGKNGVSRLMKLKEEIIKAGICSFDYESDGDPDDEAQDPQDHKLVSVSFAYQIGQAFCMPVAHDFYAANWDKDWFVENFLKPVLEHPDVIIVAQNVKFEHGMSICLGIDMFEKACNGKVMDTMIMLKALALPETMVQRGEDWDVQLGLKPATKALLADANGWVHGLLHIDQIKSFEETVGRIEWEEPIPGEFYKSGAKKGLPKTKKMSRSRTFNELPVDQETIDYGCSDSDWALGLYYKLLPMCHSEGVYDVIVELDVPRMMVLAEYELSGWKINPENLKKLGYIADKALAELAPLLQEGLIEVTKGYTDIDAEGNVLVPVGTYPMGKWRKDPVSLTIKNARPFSWGSTQHMQWLFFHVLQVPFGDVERSKTTGLPSMGEVSLDSLLETYTSSGGNKFMDVLKEKRKYDKIKSTYVGKWNEDTQEYTSGMLQFCREDTQKVHTNLRLVSTWRLASKKPNLQNCFDKKTRILTTEGWKYFYDLKKGVDKVAQYSPSNGNITFVIPTSYIEHQAENLVHITNQHVDLMATEDHRCLLKNRRSGSWKVFSAKDYRDDMHQYHAGRYAFGDTYLTKGEVDFICMTQADGYYHDGGINFGFIKERKIDRFLALTKSLKIPYTEHHMTKDGLRSFRVLAGDWVSFVKEHLGEEKVFGSWVLDLMKPSVLDLLESIYFWDGCFTRDNHYSSNVRSNVEWIQILHTLTETRANLRVYQGTANPNYQIDKTGRAYSGTANISKEIVSYNDTVYCVTVPNSYVVVERNGKVMITGNCPRPENDPMGIRGVFEAPTYDLTIDYGLFNPLTKPVHFIFKDNLSGITVWVGADYAQIELKVLAVYTGEESMIRTLVNGGDIHSSTAIDVFNLNCTEAQVKELYKPFRYQAKAVNFGLVYGLTEYGLAKDPKMKMTVQQAKVFVEQYMQRYPGVRAYMHEMITFARKHGYVETMFKHRRALPRINHPNKWVRQSEENKAINTPVQGTAADIMGLAMVNVRKDAPKWLKPVIQIHDELMCECPIEYAVEGSIILKEIMEREIEGFSEIMPLLAEPSVGKIWRHALDIKWDGKGTPYVKPKRERKELSDVTFDDIDYMMPLYQMAGIEVRC